MTKTTLWTLILTLPLSLALLLPAAPADALLLCAKIDKTTGQPKKGSPVKLRSACKVKGNGDPVEISVGTLDGFNFVSGPACAADPSLVWSENGDGTVTQCSSGLMWEMKTDDGTIHDKDNTYTWSGSFLNDFDGTAKTAFIDVLNDVSGGGASCFAGYCDWRLPTIEELSGRSDSGTGTGGIVDQSAGLCGGGSGPCTTIPGETGTLNFYWSSSTNSGDPGIAWDVHFLNGFVGSFLKVGDIYVRAVRDS